MSNDERSAANHIHHLALAPEWHSALSGDRQYRRSSIDRTLDELLAIEPALIDAEIRHENTSGGTELFPHVYGPIPVEAVVAARPVALLDDGTLDIGDVLG